MTLKIAFVIGMIVAQLGVGATDLYTKDYKTATVAGLLAVINYVIFLV